MSAAGRERLRTIVISGLGSGFYPFASGSWGSLYASVLFAGGWGLAVLLRSPRWGVDAALGVAMLAACILSVLWGEWAIARFGRKDPKQFTLDEFAGQWVALLAMPLALSDGFWRFAWILGGQFFLFRLFDVTKPPPARQLERLPAGWGVLCDDLFAGLYANLIGQLIWRATPLAGWIGLA